MSRKRVLRILVEDLADLDPSDGRALRCLQSRARGLVGYSSSGEIHWRHPHRWRRCECCLDDRELTIHHYIPQAVGGTDLDTVTLCQTCHSLAHRVWGPGDAYRGPDTARETIVLLRRELAG